MNDTFSEIDALVNDIQNNTNFLKKLFFPRIRILLGFAILCGAVTVGFLLF
jgi:hypothetical protein